jgi:KaiC/GvpD/RAD55 family RecA-like ATPase
MRDPTRPNGGQKKETEEKREMIKTGIEGFDELTYGQGIPKGANILVSGGPGTGKTIFCLQLLYNAAKNGHKALYITLEEPPERLRMYMRQFGWNVDTLEEKGLFMIRRMEPFSIARAVEAQYAKVSGKLMEMKGIPKVIPEGLNPYMVALDSVTALESAFTVKPESYRIYIEQLFRLFEETGTTTFLVTETEEAPTKYSRTGMEEFLADGVIVMYYTKVRDTRVRAIELLKLRGTRHMSKLVPFHITDKGVEIFSTGHVFEV